MMFSFRMQHNGWHMIQEYGQSSYSTMQNLAFHDCYGRIFLRAPIKTTDCLSAIDSFYCPFLFLREILKKRLKVELKSRQVSDIAFEHICWLITDSPLWAHKPGFWVPKHQKPDLIIHSVNWASGFKTPSWHSTLSLLFCTIETTHRSQCCLPSSQ